MNEKQEAARKNADAVRNQHLDDLIATGRYRECWIEGVRYALDIHANWAATAPIDEVIARPVKPLEDLLDG